MNHERFFYSTDGSDAIGPVTKEGLRLLIQNQVIGPASYLCREGETEWHRLDPETFRQPVETSRPKPPRPAPYTPNAAIMSQRREQESRLKELIDDGPMPETLKWGGWIVAMVASIILSELQISAQTESKPMLAYDLGSFVGHMIVIILLPYFISQAFKRSRRLTVQAIGIAATALLSLIGQMAVSQDNQLLAEAGAMSDQIKVDERAEIAQKGYIDGSTIQHAEDDMQKLKAEADQGNTQSAHFLSAAMSVSQEIVEKVKVSDEAEKACGNVDPAALTTLDDLDNQRAAINKLRASQVDILDDLLNYDDHLRAALANDNINPSEIKSFISGARKGGHIDQVVAIWRIKIRLSDAYLARLDFLEKRWGSWNAKGDQLLFSNTDDRDKYNAIVQNLKDDLSGIADLQKQIPQ
jgi:hypothetical protein